MGEPAFVTIGEVMAALVVVALAWLYGVLLWKAARGPWEELHNALKHLDRLKGEGETE